MIPGHVWLGQLIPCSRTSSPKWSPQPFLNDSPVLKGVWVRKRFCTPRKKVFFQELLNEMFFREYEMASLKKNNTLRTVMFKRFLKSSTWLLLLCILVMCLFVLGSSATDCFFAPTGNSRNAKRCMFFCSSEMLCRSVYTGVQQHLLVCRNDRMSCRDVFSLRSSRKKKAAGWGFLFDRLRLIWEDSYDTLKLPWLNCD